MDNIHTFIFSWKKVTENALRLYEKTSAVCANTTFINCDENVNVLVKNIHLDDSYYYGGQFEAAIRAVPLGGSLCCIVGDVSPDGNWSAIYEKAVETLATRHVGVYAPNVDYTWHTQRGRQVGNTLWEVENTDCTFWFIDADVVRVLRDIPYRMLSNLGWGIDTIVNKESARQEKLVVRDYSELVRQPMGTAYDKDKAKSQMSLILAYYDSMCLKK